MAEAEESVVIIGSGFAGSVAAARLVEAGIKVTLLERGPWRDTAPVRRAGIKQRASLPVGGRLFTHLIHRINRASLPSGRLTFSRRGVYEVHMSENLDVVCSNQVGGGSHVYGGLNMRPASPNYWDGHHEHITSQSMDSHYQYILQKMASSPPLLEDRYPNMLADRMSGISEFVTDQRSLDLAMGLSIFRGMDEAAISSSGMLGSQDGTKVTLDNLFLSPALSKGLEVRDMCEVTGIFREDRNEGTRYRVEYVNHHSHQKTNIAASKLIVAAGTMNTLKLLLQSRDREQGLDGMPMLGRHFGGNGDYSAYWRHYNNDTDLSTGLPVRGRVLLSDPDLWKLPCPWPLIVEGGLPYSGQLPWLPFVKGIVKRGTLLAGMGNDNMIGRVSYHKGRLIIEYDPDNAPILKELRCAFDLIGSLSGSPVTHFPKAMTMHPMGGACLGHSPKTGVIDDRGEVYGHPGLYIADGAALPASLGVAPSMTIAAWASNVANRMILAQ